MRKLAALLLLLGACVINTGARVDRSVSTVGRAFHNTVALQDAFGDVFCSGVIVKHMVITAAHCVDEDGPPIFVETVDGRWEAALAGKDEVSDLAALVPVDTRIALPKGVHTARKAPGFGDDVWVIGHPLGEFEFSITKGIVSHPYRKDGVNGGVWMQHDAGQTSGNSGGPVLNKHGRLVGIVSFGIIQGVRCAFACPGIYQDTHLNAAVHHDKVREFLSSL